MGMRFAVLGAALILLVCGPAVARPRDDVMANAYRCAGQSSTRIWLDCYYGAAQPVRAALRLPPAPAAQVQLVQAPPAAGVPQDVVARDTVMAGAGRCSAVADERAWLDCYYAAANPVRGVLGLALMSGGPPPGGTTPMPAAPLRQQHGNVGFISRVLGAPDVRVTSRMAAYNFNHGQNFTVTLENGQVWQQTDGDTATAHWRKDARSYLVTITGGAFGTYNLSVKGSPGLYKVRRAS